MPDKHSKRTVDLVRRGEAILVFVLCVASMSRYRYFKHGSVNFLAGSSCVSWLPKELGCELEDSLAEDDLQTALAVHGRCDANHEVSCALLLSSRMAGADSVLSCPGIQVYPRGYVLSPLGECIKPEVSRKTLWFVYRFFEGSAFFGLAAGAFAATRLEWGLKPAKRFQMHALQLTLYTQLAWIMFLGGLLVFFDSSVAPMVGDDRDRVRSFLFYRGPKHENIWEYLFFFFGKFAFIFLILALIDSDQCHWEYAADKPFDLDFGKKPLLVRSFTDAEIKDAEAEEMEAITAGGDTGNDEERENKV